MARRSNRGILLVLIGFVLLLIAFTGNPQAVFAKVVSYLSGNKSGSTSASSSGSTGSAAPASTSGSTPNGSAALVLPKTIKSQLKTNQVNDNITTTVSGNKEVYQVPTTDLNSWTSFTHWVQTHDPFFNSGVAGGSGANP